MASPAVPGPASQLHVCADATRSFLPHVRVLARSLLRFHPDVRVSVVVLDGNGSDADPRRELFETLEPSALPLSRAEFHRMATIYDAQELGAALKPWVLRRALEESEAAIWLDADVEAFERIDDLAGLSSQASIVLTPHVVKPSTMVPGRQGVFNAGVIVASRRAAAILDWWCECLRWSERVPPSTKRFWTQVWLDNLPCYFDDYAVLRDPTVNVAQWNLHEREVTWAEGRYEVDGKPLRIFHFSGAQVGGRLSPPLAEHPVVRQLCGEYRARLREEGFVDDGSPSYGFARSASGLELTLGVRRFLRDVFLSAEQQGLEPPPDPFEPAGAEMLSTWLERPAVRRAAALYGLTSYGRVGRTLRRVGLRVGGRRWDYGRAVLEARQEAVRELAALRRAWGE